MDAKTVEAVREALKKRGEITAAYLYSSAAKKEERKGTELPAAKAAGVYCSTTCIHSPC